MLKTTQAAAGNFDPQSSLGGLGPGDLDADLHQAIERGCAIRARRVLVDRGSTIRQGGKHRVAMGNRFVAGKPDGPSDATSRPHRRGGD